MSPSIPPQGDQFPGNVQPWPCYRLDSHCSSLTRSYSPQSCRGGYQAATKEHEHSMNIRTSWSMSLCHRNCLLEMRVWNSCQYSSLKSVNAGFPASVPFAWVLTLTQRAQPLAAGHPIPTTSDVGQSMATRPEAQMQGGGQRERDILQYCNLIDYICASQSG